MGPSSLEVSDFAAMFIEISLRSLFHFEEGSCPFPLGACSKLINCAVHDHVDERALNFPKAGKALNKWEMQENANIAIGAAKSLGCTIVNIHAGTC